MDKFSVKVTKTPITDSGNFNVGEEIEFTYKGEKFTGVLSDIDERHEAIIVKLYKNIYAASVFELKYVEEIKYLTFD